jgi:hypothetical protein
MNSGAKMKLLKNLEPGTKFQPIGDAEHYIKLCNHSGFVNKTPVVRLDTFCLLFFSEEVLILNYEQVSFN